MMGPGGGGHGMMGPGGGGHGMMGPGGGAPGMMGQDPYMRGGGRPGMGGDLRMGMGGDPRMGMGSDPRMGPIGQGMGHMGQGMGPMGMGGMRNQPAMRPGTGGPYPGQYGGYEEEGDHHRLRNGALAAAGLGAAGLAAAAVHHERSERNSRNGHESGRDGGRLRRSRHEQYPGLNPETSRETIRLLRRAERFQGTQTDQGRSFRGKAGKAEMYTFLAGKALTMQGMNPAAYNGRYAMYLDAYNNPNLQRKYKDGEDLMSQFMGGALLTGRSKTPKYGPGFGPSGMRRRLRSRPGYRTDSSDSTSSSDSE
jgi:hypothetical protein